MSRDFVGEMRALIDSETAAGPYVSGQVAEHIAAKLTATDPELLDGWPLRGDALGPHFLTRN